MTFGFRKDAGWTIFANAVDPRVFEAKLKHHMSRATALNGKVAVAAVRKVIRNGAFAANAPLTVHIKGSSKPLVDNGTGLFQAITDEVQDHQTVFIGVNRNSDMYNIAMALHEGVTLRVTPAMRGMFFMLWQASTGAIPSSSLTGRAAELWERRPGGWKPLKESTSVIVIPGRPFLEQAFQDPTLRNTLRNNWTQAVQATLRELATRGK